MGNKSDCVGKACDYHVTNGTPVCGNGAGSCANPHLHEAEISAFHDQNLADATRAINSILEGIENSDSGRKLSFINTKQGVLLAWVQHEGERTEDSVTIDDDTATIARALRLRSETGSATAS